MISISYFPQVLGSQALALSLAMAMMTMTLTGITTLSSSLVQSAHADHGQEIVLTPRDTSFAPVSSGEGGNQVKVVVNYAVHEPMVTNDLVKGVMKVYSPNGSLLKTSSSPTPFPITNSHGTATFATTLTDPTIKDVISRIVFTNPIKTETLSNELPVSVSLTKEAALTGESKERAISQTPPGSDQQSKEENEPLPDNTLPSRESVIASPRIEEERQSVKFEDVPPIQESQQVTPTESKPQTIVNPYVSTYPPIQPTIVEPEICNDSIDNDVDTLIDLSDADCNLSQIQQQQLPKTMQQEPSKVSSLEICDDDLDNDLDSKVDSKDEECTYNTDSTSSFPLLGQEQSVAGEQTEEDEGKAEVKEQQSDKELAKGSDEKEEGNGGDSSEELNNEEGEEENEDEDEDEDEG
jgi:hypothetical protein